MAHEGFSLDSVSDLMDRKVCVTCEKIFENDSDKPKNRICEKCKECIRENKGITCSCNVCETDFEDYITLKEHMDSSHPILSVIACQLCDKLFLEAVGLAQNSTDTCKMCGDDTRENMVYFFPSKNKSSSPYCNLCNKKFNSDSIPQHLWAHAKSLPYGCKICSSAFLDYDHSFKVHMKDHYVSCEPTKSDLGEQGGL